MYIFEYFASAILRFWTKVLYSLKAVIVHKITAKINELESYENYKEKRVNLSC